jgi:hypothetical protein
MRITLFQKRERKRAYSGHAPGGTRDLGTVAPQGSHLVRAAGQNCVSVTILTKPKKTGAPTLAIALAPICGAVRAPQTRESVTLSQSCPAKL